MSNNDSKSFNINDVNDVCNNMMKQSTHRSFNFDAEFDKELNKVYNSATKHFTNLKNKFYNKSCEQQKSSISPIPSTQPDLITSPNELIKPTLNEEKYLEIIGKLTSIIIGLVISIVVIVFFK